jgi:hypothetical protein
MAPPYPASTGLASLDRVVEGLRPGDNVVWQVDSVEDYVPFVRPFVVDARVEVNPVSKEQLQRTREFIANPPTGTRAPAGSRSVLGAMASFLLREPAPSDDVTFLRSRPFARGEIGLP